MPQMRHKKTTKKKSKYLRRFLAAPVFFFSICFEAILKENFDCSYSSPASSCLNSADDL